MKFEGIGVDFCSPWAGGCRRAEVWGTGIGRKLLRVSGCRAAILRSVDRLPRIAQQNPTSIP